MNADAAPPPILKPDPLASALAVLNEAYERSVHVYGCAMLNAMVADDAWHVCNCWLGRARKILRGET